MGKASSAKKVARAARAGGSARRDRPQIGFPLSIFLILLFGSMLVVYARTSRDPAGASEAPSYLAKDHWHAAYGVYVCDHFLPPLNESATDPLGIHTHGDGIIHIHPFGASASGANARLGKFTDVTWTDDGFTLADGTQYVNGQDCNGKPGKVLVYRFKADDPTAPVEVFDSGFANIRFRGDRDAYTIAVVPDGVEPNIPLPDSVSQLDNLSDVGPTGAGGATPSLPIDPTASLPIDPTASLPIDPTASLPIDPTASLPIDPTASVPSIPPVSLPSDAGATPSSTPTTSTP